MSINSMSPAVNLRGISKDGDCSGCAELRIENKNLIERNAVLTKRAVKAERLLRQQENECDTDS